MTEELFTGWAPDAPVDDTVLRQFSFALADRLTTMAGRLDRPVHRSAAVAAADLGSPVPFDNGVVLLQPPTMADPLAVVDELVAFFPPERAWVLFSPWPLPDLAGRGLTLLGHPPVMLRPAGGAVPAAPPGLRIEPVTDAATLDTFVATLVEAYPAPGGEGAYRPEVLGDPLHLFVGYEGDRPVGTAGCWVDHGLCDVEWVSVMPDCRGRGYGEALTWAATVVDPSLPAALIASDPGQPVYERMGYLRLLRFTAWARGWS